MAKMSKTAKIAKNSQKRLKTVKNSGPKSRWPRISTTMNLDDPESRWPQISTTPNLDDPESWWPQISTTSNLDDPESRWPQISMILNLDDPESRRPWILTTPRLDGPESQQPWNSTLKSEGQRGASSDFFHERQLNLLVNYEQKKKLFTPNNHHILPVVARCVKFLWLCFIID